MAGGPSLEEHFAHPKLEAFSQRLAARCYLEPLSRDETTAYIRAQVEACDSSANALLHEDAFEAVYRATDGLPRLINQVCDHALVLAYADGLTDISAELIEQAWADLQQLPTPWSVPDARSSQRGGGAIEFGRLDDDPFSPDAELPSVPFPTGRVERRDGPHDDAFDDEHDDAFSVHSADDGADVESRDDFIAATSASEVELTVAEDAVDPFGEPFEEEVAVVDPVAALDQTRTASKPLAPPPRPAPRSTAAAAAAEPPPPATVMLPRPAGASPAANPPWPSGNPAALSPSAADATSAAPSTKPSVDTRLSRPAAALRKPRKYGQLFSQLRRNSG
jgi:hypothetical protein